MNELNKAFGNTRDKIEVRKGLIRGSRYVRPPRTREIPERMMKYSKAEQLAKDIDFDGSPVYVFVDGTFIFGDFIEALIVEKNWLVDRLVIATLSLSQNNVDSIKNLIEGDYVRKVDMIVSDYFYSHERHKNGLVPYMYEQLDKKNIFQLAAAGSHCKITLIKTSCGKHIVMHGSANLRSSSNIEQVHIEENKTLYEFNERVFDAILETYATIKKSVRYNKLWNKIN